MGIQLTAAVVGRRLVLGGVLGGVAVAAASPAGAAPAPDTIALPDGLRPEGITSGPGQTFYVGSLADGRIVTGDLRTGEQSVLLPGAGGRQIRGLYYDTASGLVWAVGNVGAEAHVWAVDGATGEVVADIVVEGAVFLNDLVVADRTVWVTDSRVDRLTVIDLGADGLPVDSEERFIALSGDWPAGDGAAINANGIRRLPGGDLLLNNSRVGGLWQVDAETGVVTAIPVSGGSPLTGGDGLELRGTTVYDVRGSGNAEVSVIRLTPTAGGGWRGTWVTALTDPTLDVPSTATLSGGSLWAVNARFGVASPGAAPYWITRLDT